MRLHVFYRLYPPENWKRRPTFHSKELCLRSLVRSLDRVPDSTLTVLVDADALTPELAAELAGRPDAKIEYLGGQGNVQSYATQLDHATAVAPDDIVYLSEDDYLYLPDAMPALLAAAAEMPEVDFLTLYDHPDRYRRDDDARIRTRRPVYFGGGWHWRRVESSCLTYGARAGALRRDRKLHGYNKWGFPVSRLIWRRTQGIARWWWRLPKAQLVGAVPSLATHMDTDNMAPHIDWAQVAAELAD